MAACVRAKDVLSMGCDVAEVKRSAGGRVFRGLLAGEGEVRSVGGGVILTKGDETARLPLRTELLPLRLQETAESDLEGV